MSEVMSEEYVETMKIKLARAKQFLEKNNFTVLEMSIFPNYSCRITAQNNANNHNETFRVTERALELLCYSRKGKWYWKLAASFEGEEKVNKKSYKDKMKRAVNGE